MGELSSREAWPPYDAHRAPKGSKRLVCAHSRCPGERALQRALSNSAKSSKWHQPSVLLGVVVHLVNDAARPCIRDGRMVAGLLWGVM